MCSQEQKQAPYQRDSLARVWKRNISAYRQFRYNRSFVSEFDRRNLYLKDLIHAKGLFQIKQPFHCRYGNHIYLGRDLTCGHDGIFEDEANIRIGDHVQMGHGVKLITTKPILDPALRKQHRECAEDIIIGDHVYIGHDVTILAGVTIGSCSIIGDGSIVRESIPEGSVYTGNPACIDASATEELKPFTRGDLQNDALAESLLEKVANHINLEYVDTMIKMIVFGTSTWLSYLILKDLLEKKALFERSLLMLDKLPQSSSLLQQGNEIIKKLKK